MKKLLAIAIVLLILAGIGYYYLVYKQDVVQAFLLPGWEFVDNGLDDRKLIYKNGTEIGFLQDCPAEYTKDECLGLTPATYFDPKQIAEQEILGAQVEQYRYSVKDESTSDLDHYDLALLIYRDDKENNLLVIYNEKSGAAVDLQNKIDDIFGK